ncbi:hypothetical protein L211DRAFT_869345 [Terfezia boudieri ATCC MYA-4762]|uniref:Uncharacterized protein n=1 Tax=Terfezia boudieri ATCC MYA-4762 TaxID=1051890 RepID=A0A3N4LHI7_9PEZI|nr:hypothetical protein L211DRAFT_869345 [Terfezia boudieri ATCC MYA-4762]
MDLDVPDLSGLWVWSQTPESGTLRQNALQMYNASFENFLDPGSFQAAIQSKWDEHCAPTNSRLLPWNPAPKHKNRTALLVNNAQNRAFFDEPVPPDAPTYGLIYYDVPGEGRRKRRKRDGFTEQDLGALYKGMDFRGSPCTPDPRPVRRGPSPDGIAVDPLDNAELMADIDSDADEVAIGVKLSMDLFRRRYGPIRYPLNQIVHPTLHSATLQRRFFRKNPKHKNASHVYFPWNRDPDDNILGTGHLAQGEWKAVSSSIPVKDRIKSWYRTHREAPLASEAMEDVGLNRKYPLAEQRTIDPITQHQVVHQRVQKVPLPEVEDVEEEPGDEGLKTPLPAGQTVTQTNTQTGHSTAQLFGKGSIHGPGPVGLAAASITYPTSQPSFGWPKFATPGTRKVMGLRGGEGITPSGSSSSSSSSLSSSSIPEQISPTKWNIPPFEPPQSVLDKLGDAAEDFSKYMPDYILRLIQWAGVVHQGKMRSGILPHQPIHEAYNLTFSFPTNARPPPVNVVDVNDWCWCCRRQGVDMKPEDLKSHIEFGICPHMNANYIGNVLDNNEDYFLRLRLGSPPLEKRTLLQELLKKLTPGARERIKSRVKILNIAMTLFRRRRKEAIAKGRIGMPEPVYEYVTKQIQTFKGHKLEELARDELTATAGGYTNLRDEERAQRAADQGTAKWEKSERQLDPHWEPSTDDEDDGDEDYVNDDDEEGSSRGMKGSVVPPGDLEKDSDVAVEISDPEEDALLVAEIAAEKLAKVGRRPIPAGYTAKTWLVEVEKREEAKANARKTAQEAKDTERKKKTEAAKAREAFLNPLMDKFMADISPPGTLISQEQIIKLTAVLVSALGALMSKKKALEAGRNQGGSQDGETFEPSALDDAAKGERRRKAEEEANEKEKAWKEKAGKEQQARKEKSRKEKERAEKEDAEKEKAEKAKAEKEQARKRMEKERAEKEEAEKEKAERENAEKAEKEKAGNEQASKDKSRKEKERAEKEEPEKEKAERENTERGKARKGKAAKEQASKKKEKARKKAEKETDRTWTPPKGDETSATGGTDDIGDIFGIGEIGETRNVGGTNNGANNGCRDSPDDMEVCHDNEKCVKTPVKHTYICRWLWHPKCGRGHKAADDELKTAVALPNQEPPLKGWRLDRRIFCPLCGRQLSTLTAAKLRGHMIGRHHVTESLLCDYFISRDTHRAIVRQIQAYADGVEKTEQIFTKPRNPFTDGIIRLHATFKNRPGDQDTSPVRLGPGPSPPPPPPPSDEEEDDEDAAASHRGDKRGKKGRPKRTKVAVSKAKLLGVVPYASGSIGGYDPPNSFTLPGPLIHHNRHRTPVSYGIVSTGTYNTVAPRNWMLYPPITPEYVEEATEDESSMVVSDKRPHKLMKQLTIDDTNTLFEIDNEVAQCKGVNYAHHSWDLPRYAYQGRRILYPLEDQLEFCRLQKGILRSEIEQAHHPINDGNKRRRTLANLFGPRISAFDELPPGVIDTKNHKGQWTCVPDIVHQVGDMSPYWKNKGFEVPGTGIVNPVMRLIEIKREYPAPILGWTQKDGRMDYSWLDPETLMECNNSCGLPKEAKKFMDKWKKQKGGMRR